MSHYHFTAAYVGQVLGRLSMDHLPGCRLIQDGSHINGKHIYGVSQPSYALDMHMDESSPHYCCPHPLVNSFSYLIILELYKKQSHIIEPKLRLFTHQRWLPHQWQTHIMCITARLNMLWMCIWMRPEPNS